jgi:hypothetical protein
MTEDKNVTLSYDFISTFLTTLLDLDNLYYKSDISLNLIKVLE